MCKSRAQGGRRCAAHTRPAYRQVLAAWRANPGFIPTDAQVNAVVAFASTPAGATEIRHAVDFVESVGDIPFAAVLHHATRLGAQHMDAAADAERAIRTRANPATRPAGSSTARLGASRRVCLRCGAPVPASAVAKTGPRRGLCQQCSFRAAVAEVEAENPAPSLEAWADSPYLFYKQQNSRTKGAIGEAIVENWLAGEGFTVTRAENAEHDRIVNGHKIEVKTSTPWEQGAEAGQFSFSQIRDQDYEYAVLLGLTPDSQVCWIIPKDVVRAMSKPQHGGSAGSDTRWLQFPYDTPPAGLAVYGGTMDAALKKARLYLS